MPRKYAGRSARERDGDVGWTVTVGLPSPCEGVSEALRSTFAPVYDALPADMMSLLASLDKR